MSAAEIPDDDRALVVAPEFGVFDDLSDVAHGYYIEGFSERAVDACRRWASLSIASGDVLTTRYLRYIEAISLQELGRDAEAVEVAERLLAELADGREPAWRAKSLAVVAESSGRLGQHGRAMVALAEAHWLIRSISPRTYGHLSASMAVALALRSVNLLDESDVVLSTIANHGDPGIEVLVAQELALLSAFWGASLLLLGREAEAARRFRAAWTRARRMVALAESVENEQMALRGAVIEAYATMHLVGVELAAARARAVLGRFSDRPELLETHLLHLVLASAAVHERDFPEAHRRLDAVIEEAERASRDMWAATGRLAAVDAYTAELGSHPAVELMKTVTRSSLARVWSEREGRFAALQDRHRLRELTAETRRIGRAVRQDHLTGLGNRRLLDEVSGDAVLAADGHDHPWAVFVDIDDFKAINDSFSHSVGDDVLQALADILRGQSREGDVLIRYGGDEFLVLPQDGEDGALAIAERVHASVAAYPWAATAPGLEVTVSIGVGRTPDGSSEPWAAADAALLTAKRAGRNRIAIAHSGSRGAEAPIGPARGQR